MSPDPVSILSASRSLQEPGSSVQEVPQLPWVSVYGLRSLRGVGMADPALKQQP